MYHCGSRIAPKASLFASAAVLRLLCRKMFKLRARGFRATVRMLAETGFRVQGLGFRALIHGYTIPEAPWLQSSAQARRGLHPDIRASQAPSSMLLGLCPKAETLRQPENVTAHRAWADAAVCALRRACGALPAASRSRAGCKLFPASTSGMPGCGEKEGSNLGTAP